MTRDHAISILHEFVQSESLRKHAYSVEACMVAYAHKYQQDPEPWSLTALLHDFDWEIHPTLDEHPQKGEAILAQRGVPEDIRRAILSHAQHTGVPRVTLMEKVLFACDELSGFLTACALVKPSKSLRDVEVTSVKKKLKDKAFARAVSRDDVYQGAEELGIPLEEHIEFCRLAMLPLEPA